MGLNLSHDNGLYVQRFFNMSAPFLSKDTQKERLSIGMIT